MSSSSVNDFYHNSQAVHSQTGLCVDGDLQSPRMDQRITSRFTAHFLPRSLLMFDVEKMRNRNIKCFGLVQGGVVSDKFVCGL